MVPRKEVPSLKNVSLQALQNCITQTCSDCIGMANSLDDFAVWIERLKKYINDETLWCLHDQIAEHILRAAEKFFSAFDNALSRTQHSFHYYKGIAILRLTVSIVPFLKVTKIEFGEWAEPIHAVLFELLDKMTHIKTLDLRCHFKSQCPRLVSKKVLRSFKYLSNLTSVYLDFLCTDEILSILSEYCQSIRKVFIVLSRQVTDRGCAYLEKFEELQEVELNGTSVTPQGYHKLLRESKSRILFSIGACNFTNRILDLFEKEPFRIYQLRRLQCCNLDLEHLILVCKYFPFLRALDVNYSKDFTSIPDFLSLSQLDHLNIIKVSSSPPSGPVTLQNPVINFLSVKGFSITSLSLGSVYDLQTSNFVDIAKHCPNLESLEFYRCRFSDNGIFSQGELSPKPFQKLKNFNWSINHSLSHAEIILRYAYDLEVIEIKPLSFSIDDFLVNVLNHNPLKKLRILRVDHSNTMSYSTIRLIVLKCQNISVLGNFMYSKDVQKNWLKRVQNYLNKKNRDFTIV